MAFPMKVDDPESDQPVAAASRWAYSSLVTQLSSPFAESVRSVVDAEIKNRFLGFVALTARVTNALPFSLSHIVEGTGSVERVGDWVQPVSLEVTVLCEGDNDSKVNHNSVRVGVLQYHEDESQHPFDPNTLLHSASLPMGSYNYLEKGQFSVLWDQYVTLGTVVTSSNYLATCSCSLDLSALPRILFKGPDDTRNQLFFFAMTNAFAATTNAPSFTMASSFYYTDS